MEQYTCQTVGMFGVQTRSPYLCTAVQKAINLIKIFGYSERVHQRRPQRLLSVHSVRVQAAKAIKVVVKH